MMPSGRLELVILQVVVCSHYYRYPTCLSRTRFRRASLALHSDTLAFPARRGSGNQKAKEATQRNSSGLGKSPFGPRVIPTAAISPVGRAHRLPNVR